MLIVVAPAAARIPTPNPARRPFTHWSSSGGQDDSPTV